MKLLCSLLCALMFLSYAAQAKVLNIVAGLNKPPYVFEQDGEFVGFEIELVKLVMANMGYETKFHLVPFARSIKLLDKEGVDAVMTISPKLKSSANALSKPYISYQNVAISLRKNKLKLNTISDLGKHSMASFQMASKVLGKPFYLASTVSPYYTELSEQSRQLVMLKQNKVDIVVMDINIFNYFSEGAYPQVDVHEVFPISPYTMAFKDTDLVGRFDAEMAKFLASPAYKSLAQKYDMKHILSKLN